MKSAGDNLIILAVQENAAGMSRKATRALVLSGLVKKTEEKLMICVRCNLIMVAASESMDFWISPGFQY
jgi:hypothetical protein